MSLKTEPFSVFMIICCVFIIIQHGVIFKKKMLGINCNDEVIFRSKCLDKLEDIGL